MPSTTLITTSQLSKLIGLPQAPAIIDVRTDEDYHVCCPVPFAGIIGLWRNGPQSIAINQL